MLKFTMFYSKLIASINRGGTKISSMGRIELFSNSQKHAARFEVSGSGDFEQKVINSQKPVIAFFRADWCDICKRAAPTIVEKVGQSDKVDLAEINVENNSDIADKFKVTAVPTLLAFRDGSVVDQFVGMIDASSLEALINKL